MKKVVLVMTLILSSLPFDSQANRLSHFVGTWTGTRTYDLPGLKGTETFTMRVSLFQKTGMRVEATLERPPGWDKVEYVEIFYPGNDLVGASSDRTSVYDVRVGRWKAIGKRLTWNWFMYYSNLGERSKNKTTWSIDSKGQLQEIRTTDGGTIKATATKAP
jgi:hypothetical protein